MKISDNVIRYCIQSLGKLKLGRDLVLVYLFVSFCIYVLISCDLSVVNLWLGFMTVFPMVGVTRIVSKFPVHTHDHVNIFRSFVVNYRVKLAAKPGTNMQG